MKDNRMAVPRLALALVLAVATAASSPTHAQVTVDDWSPPRRLEPAARAQARLVAELRTRPQDADAHLRYGRSLARELETGRISDWRQAAAAFEFALQLDPTLPTARAELGRVYAFAGRSRLAEQLLAEHLAVQGGDAPALADYALAALRNGDLAQALWAARAAAGLSGARGPLTAAAMATGIAGSTDAPDALARLRRLDSGAGDRVAADIAAWRRAAALALALAPAQSPIAAPPSVAPSATDWRACDPAAANAGNYSAYTSTTQPLGPQPLAALPAPCAGAPPPAMVVIEAVIVRQRDESSDLRGVNLLSTLQLVARGRFDVSGRDPATQGKGFLTLSLPDNGLTYLLDILDDRTARTEVLAKPSLVALDRSPSVFFSGATLTVPVSGQYSSTLQEKAIGVSLSVTPTFVSDGEMLLAVNAGRSFLEDGLDAQLDQAIQTTTNNVSANVRLRFGETLVLSGLVERESLGQRSAVPGLGRMPIGNLLLSSRTRQTLRNNVIVLLTPRRPDEGGARPEGDDSLLPVRYDQRLAEAFAANARQQTPEAGSLDDLGQALRRADLLTRLPLPSLESP